MRRFMYCVLACAAWTGCGEGGSANECKINDDCNLASGGECVPNATTGNTWCTYPDSTCPSGRRWSDVATGDGLSGLCVGDENGPDGGVDAGGDAGPDTTAPTVSLTSPTDNATGVDTTVVLSAVFSEPLAPASVTTSTFMLETQGGSPVTGVVAVDGAIATFSPGSPLLPDTIYAASLGTGITDLAGNALAAEESWSFTTTSGGWTTPTVLESELDKGASALAVARAGDFAIAVWTMAPCSGSVCQLDRELWASIYSNGAWAAAAVVPTSSMRVQLPAVAIDASGRATVVWYDTSAALTTVRANRYESGSWSAVVTLQTESLGHADRPNVAMDSSGNAYAVWQQADGTTTNIWANKFTAGGAWGTAGKVETAAESATRPVVTVNSSGTAVAMWNQNSAMWASTNTGSAWSARAQVSADDGVPPALVTGTTDVIAAWPSGTDVYASRYTGVWSTAEAIDASPYTVVSGGLTLAADTGGDTLAVWVQGDVSSQDVWYARHRSAQGWGSASRIENSPGQANAPAVAYGAAGLAMAVWQQPASGQVSIWANSFNPSVGWGAPHLLELDDNSGASSPFVFFDPVTSTFNAVWLHAITGPTSVYWSRFE